MNVSDLHALPDRPAERPFSKQELRRAARHHRRAIRALQSSHAFADLSAGRTDALLGRLQRDLRHLEARLGTGDAHAGNRQ